MRMWTECGMAVAAAWSWNQLTALPHGIAEAAHTPNALQDISATAILAGLLWFVMRELRVAVDRQAEAISKLKDSLDGWESALRALLHAPDAPDP